jgi:para-aminobenzoate synthetase/4-amino-4-deoxychorismate lyase
VVTAPQPRFSLLETLRWAPEEGFGRLERHLARLADSADYFFRRFDPAAARRRLELAVRGLTAPHRVRLLVAEDGTIDVELAPLEPVAVPRRVALATVPVDERDGFLCHKTTHRAVYERAREATPGTDDVLLWNRRGEITESTVANLVVERRGELLTPAASCGLLPGTLRAELLAQGRVREAILRRDDLDEAEALFLVSSLRGWLRVELVGTPETRFAGPT